jgi:hypothetical protein
VQLDAQVTAHQRVGNHAGPAGSAPPGGHGPGGDHRPDPARPAGGGIRLTFLARVGGPATRGRARPGRLHSSAPAASGSPHSSSPARSSRRSSNSPACTGRPRKTRGQPTSARSAPRQATTCLRNVSRNGRARRAWAGPPRPLPRPHRRRAGRGHRAAESAPRAAGADRRAVHTARCPHHRRGAGHTPNLTALDALANRIPRRNQPVTPDLETRCDRTATGRQRTQRRCGAPRRDGPLVTQRETHAGFADRDVALRARALTRGGHTAAAT